MFKVGLYFGSFNPIHNGHLSIANYCKNHYNLKELHFIVSPQNPFKKECNLLSFDDRLNLVNKSCFSNSEMYANDIESKLSLPSYTINTINALQTNYGDDCEFTIIMGMDNWLTLHRWKNYEDIINKCSFIVIPRLNNGGGVAEFNEQLIYLQCIVKNDIKVSLETHIPISSMSSTFIRNEIREGRDIIGYVPEAVRKIIFEKNFYK